MIPIDQIIIIAEKNVEKASQLLVKKLIENYNIKSYLCSSKEYNKNNFSPEHIVICIGLNKITLKIRDSLTEVYKSDLFRIRIRIKEKLATIFVLPTSRQRKKLKNIHKQQTINSSKRTEKSIKGLLQRQKTVEEEIEKDLINGVEYFINNYLENFINDSLPRIVISEPNPAPPAVEKTTPGRDPKPVKETPTDYPEEQKYDKEFYEIDEGIFKLKYFDEEALIKDSTPLQYCYYVLSRPHRQISLTEIFCGVNDEEPNYIAPLIEGAVIDKNVNKTVVENLINDYNEKILLLERAKLIIFQEEDALNGIFHDGDIDIDATKPTSKFDKEKEKERIKKAKELALRYLDSMDRLEKELEAYVDIVKKLNEQLKYQPKEVSNERNRYASRIRMGFSSFYKVLKARKLYRLHDYLNSNIDVYNGYIYHPDDDFTTWKLTK